MRRSPPCSCCLAEREGHFDVKPGAPERADYLQRMFFLANTVQPAFRAWFYPDEPAGARTPRRFRPRRVRFWKPPLPA